MTTTGPLHPPHREADDTDAGGLVVARLLVGEESFAIVPGRNAGSGAPDAVRLPGEQARFNLSGYTFIVIKEAGRRQPATDDPILARLTGRELQIAVLVAQGDPVKRIAYKMGITDWTVKEYLRRIFAKLGVRSQAAMVFRCASVIQHLEHHQRRPYPGIMDSSNGHHGANTRTPPDAKTGREQCLA